MGAALSGSHDRPALSGAHDGEEAARAAVARYLAIAHAASAPGLGGAAVAAEDVPAFVPAARTAPLAAALGATPLEAAVLGAFFTVAPSWEARRWLARLGVATTRGDLVLNAELVAALCGGAGAAAVDTALDRLAARHLLDHEGGAGVSTRRYRLPTALLRFAAVAGRAAALAEPLELEPGLTLEPAPAAELRALGLAAWPEAGEARRLVSRALDGDEVTLAAAALAGGPWLRCDGRNRDAAPGALSRALALAAIDDRLVLVRLRGHDAGSVARVAAALAAAGPRAGPRALLELDAEPPLPPALDAVELARPEAGLERVIAALAEHHPEAAQALEVARALDVRLGAGLRAMATALHAPERVHAIAAATARAAVSEVGLRPHSAPDPDDVLDDADHRLLADALDLLRTRRDPVAWLDRLAPASLVVRITCDDPGRERAAVAWLGQRTGRAVLRLDAASAMSRYVGETEQNLRRQLEVAARLGALVYLPAADSLLGRRLAVTSSNDRYANQQVNFLLQLLDSATCDLVLSTDRGHELDPALQRRVLYTIELPPLDAAGRARWLERLLPTAWPCEPGIDLSALARAPLGVDQLGRAVVAALSAACAAEAPLATAHLERELAAQAVTRS